MDASMLDDGQRVAVLVSAAREPEVAELIAQVYGLSAREREVTRLVLHGRSTNEIAAALHVSPYTVQDHLKSIFAKTGVRSRSELVSQIFLEHYVPRWEAIPDVPAGWLANASPVPAGTDSHLSPDAAILG